MIPTHVYVFPLEQHQTDGGERVQGAAPSPACGRAGCGRPQSDPVHVGQALPDPEPAPPPKHRGAGGLWTCDGCGAVDPWAPGWRWLGKLEDRKGNGPIIERVLCPKCGPREQGDEPTLPS